MDVKAVKKDYQLFWSLYPNLSNPTDINCQEKFDFMMKVGWVRFNQMQKARKAGYDWTKRERK